MKGVDGVKRTVAIALVIVMLGTLVACSGSEPLSRQPLDEKSEAWNSYPEIVSKNLAVPGEDISGKIPVYHEEELLLKTGGTFYLNRDAVFNSDLSFNPNYTGAILTAYPTTAMRDRDGSTVYFIYETDTGYRLFLFLEKDGEDLRLRGFPVLVKELLPYDSYAELKIGDSIDTVEQIDSTISFYKKEIYEVWKLDHNAAAAYADRGSPCTSFHYLKDGILKIEYEMLEDQSLIVSNMVYSEDYELVSANGKTLNYRIEDIDLP